MSPRSDVVLLTVENQIADAVKAALAHAGRLALDGVCRTMPELASRLAAGPAAAALVDVDPEPDRVLQELEPVIARYPRTRFVLLSRSPRQELLLEAMQIGARHFMRKETLGTELANVLQRLVVDATRDQGGSAIVVLSASGGCGATTIAVNLVNELSLRSGRACLLVDLDCSYGAAAIYLGLKGEYGIADVVSRAGGADAGLVTSSASVYDEHVHVLLSPCSVNFSLPAEVHYGPVSAMLTACRLAYPFTVVDAPRVSAQSAESLALASNMALIVMQMTVKDIHIARSLRSVLVSRGLPPDRILHVINRYQKRNQMISFDQCREALGSDRYERISNDFRGAVRSLNFGQPLSKSAPSSSLRSDIRQLANRLVLETIVPSGK